jgi:hypothetical protein
MIFGFGIDSLCIPYCFDNNVNLMQLDQTRNSCPATAKYSKVISALSIRMSNMFGFIFVITDVVVVVLNPTHIILASDSVIYSMGEFSVDDGANSFRRTVVQQQFLWGVFFLRPLGNGSETLNWINTSINNFIFRIFCFYWNTSMKLQYGNFAAINRIHKCMISSLSMSN